MKDSPNSPEVEGRDECALQMHNITNIESRQLAGLTSGNAATSGNRAKVRLSHLVTGKADASFEGSLYPSKWRTRPSKDADPELGCLLETLTAVPSPLPVQDGSTRISDSEVQKLL